MNQEARVAALQALNLRLMTEQDGDKCHPGAEAPVYCMLLNANGIFAKEPSLMPWPLTGPAKRLLTEQKDYE